MFTQQQTLFRTIILHNKLMTEHDVDDVLTHTSDPEQAIIWIVDHQIIPKAVAVQLMGLYHKKLEKAAVLEAAMPPPRSDVERLGTPVRHGPLPGFPPAAPKTLEPVPPTPRHPKDAAHPTVTIGTGPIDVTKGGIHLLHQLLQTARNMNASDLHIKSGATPVARVAGALVDLELPPITLEVVKETLFCILDHDHLEHFNHTNDVDFCYNAGPELGRFRTNFLFQHNGYDGIFRIINSHVPTFDELKLPTQVRRFCDYHQGIVLVTGPKASGKTTTLAALIDRINSTRPQHIITIEDPIEFVHKSKMCHVNQREVGPHTRTFSHALRASMREAPDVIMVGEMRDLETTSLAITAAAMGTLVYATLHTPDAVRTIGRVLDVFPPQEQPQIRAMFAESLRGIISQLLIPSVDGKSMELATEILFNNPAISNMIHEGRAFQLRSVMQTGKKLGMMVLDESVAQLAREGRISKEEALAHADNIGLMERDLAAMG
jgi:twitching motility protein PilT